jgi:adenylyltransferase/sulfurtransferase
MTSDYPLELSPAEAVQLRAANPDGVLLLDVREPFEFELCQLPDSDFIPMRQIPEHLDTLPRDKHLLVLCHHGSRSLRVTQFLRAKGFEKVSNIAGGIDAWAQEVDPSLARY